MLVSIGRGVDRGSNGCPRRLEWCDLEEVLLQTAIYAGLLVYLAPTLVLFGFTMMGMLTMAMFVKGSIASIVSTLAASVAGASIYKETEAPAGARAYAR